MKLTTLLFTLFITITVTSQSVISGKITDYQKNTITGANVYLKGTYDGASSNPDGTFSFSTTETGIQTLIVSFVSFQTYEITTDISTMKNLTIRLKEDENTLDTVVINAGSFKAGNAKSATLTALDVVTTAGASGDVFGAFQMLPGTSKNENDGRLFVRGGDADETQIFIDGMKVFQPYLATGSGRNLPTRGRFSSFLFKGMNFSTGGYSSEFSQALSGILTLNTIDEPIQEKTDISLMSLGLGVGNTQIWSKNSFSINTSYINLQPYLLALPDRNNWINPYESISGEMVFRHKPNENGLLKLYSSFSVSDFELLQHNINYKNGFLFGVKNRNIYVNGTFRQRLNNGWKFFAGISYGNDNTKVKAQKHRIKNIDNSAHLKIKFQKRFSNMFTLNFGTEYLTTKFAEKFNKEYGFTNAILGSFIETDILFSKKIATKFGIHFENTTLLDELTISPRISLAYKTGKTSQISLAYGQFYQNPKNEYLKFSKDFYSENSKHFIANYQYEKNGKTLRVEGFYKQYNNLIKYTDDYVNRFTQFSNSGNGYAKGLELFWKDKKSIKFLEYWLSYSFLDTQRNFKNYPVTAQPNFAPKHNLSVVGKYWVNRWKTMLGATYSFASGRTYTNPNTNGFLNNTTKNYNSVSLNASYLITPQKIVHFSVNNILGNQNIYGYDYKNTPNSNGVYERKAITPSSDRFFFIGFFWTISNDKKSNQLNKL